MADRYWVGGTASWDGTAGTKWAATSGGPGGETVPTSADDVFFSSASTGTVTIVFGNTGAKSINCTGFTGTITGTGAISVAGSVTLVAGMNYTHTGTVTITGTGTLTTAGKTFSAVTVDGDGITVTLGGAINLSNRSLVITRGNFDTANFSIAAGTFSSSNSNLRTISLGSSTISVGLGTSSDIFFSNTANLTFNAQTSQINVGSSVGGFNGGELTFNNVSFTSTGTGARTLAGSSTFNNLTLVAPSASGISTLTIGGNPTITGTLTCAGATPLRRTFVRSDTSGTVRTITATAISGNNCDFRDITLTGAASGAAPTGAGNCGGNSGINFPSPKTVYRVGSSTTWAGSSSWALSSGGGGSDNNFPLAQDTAIIDNGTTLTGTLAIAAYNLPALDCSNRTTGITLNHNAIGTWHGSYTLGAGVTVAGTSTQIFANRAVANLTTAGKTITFPVQIEGPGGTLRLLDSFISSNTITHTAGTFDANNFNVSFTNYITVGTLPRTTTMGSGLWTLSGVGTVWNIATLADFTFNKDTANILLSNTSSASRTFLASGLSYNKLTIGGATGESICTISQGSFTELASIKTVPHTVRPSTSTVLAIDTWSITGTAGNLVTVTSNSAGIRRYFSLTNIATGIDYLIVSDIGESNGGKFYVGANSIDGGNNENVYFSEPPFNVGNMFAMFASA